MNKRFLFLMAWFDGSPTAEEMGEKNGIKNSNDLYSEYQNGNGSVLSFEIFAPNAAVARAIGVSNAVSDDYGSYTLEDTVSTVEEISKDGVIHTLAKFTVTEDTIDEKVY